MAKGEVLAVGVYKLTAQGSFAGDFGLRDQMRRAAVGIPSNIAESDERDANKDSVRFLYIAKGSPAELATQLEIAHAIGYLSEAGLKLFDQRCSKIGRMPGGLIKIRTQTPTKPITSNQ